jgi:outer membrane protein OmpA-like peptidoglycan-associated protein
MSQSVDRLKELLFDTEARELSDLHRRLDVLFERAGTHERFASSVANVLDTALRQAEVDRHAELADAIAPLVVRTVKTEIRNSRDELVDALYPVTGRMVKAYVASAMRDLANDINRRLEANPVMLRLRSLTSGKSVGELAMAEAQKLRIEELYLVRRGTGELLARWPDAADPDGRDHVMSGILTAINEFSSEALKGEGSALRQIDIGERQLFLRASEKYLLAAKCSGVAPPALESMLDEAFLNALEAIQSRTAAIEAAETGAGQRTQLLSGFSRDLDTKLTEKHAELASEAAGISPLKLIAWLIGVPLAVWLAWLAYANYRTERAHLIASRVIAEQTGLKGYPTRLAVDWLGYGVTISGLAPNMAARDDVVASLQKALPGTTVRDQLSVLPSGLAEVEPEIEKVRRDVRGLEAEVEPEFEKVKSDLAGLRAQVTPEVDKVKSDLAGLKAGVEPELALLKREVAAIEAQAKRSVVVRALDRASRRLTEADGDLARLAAAMGGDESAKSLVKRTTSEVAAVIKDLATYKARSAGQGLQGLAELTTSLNSQTARLRQTGAELSTLISAAMNKAYAPGKELAVPTDVSESAEELAAEAERLSTLAVAVTQAIAVKDTLPTPPGPTPRERLDAWTRANAVFFSNGTEYREPARAERSLDELARLMRETGVLIRVVGYTDEQGGPSSNTSLSTARAQKVADGLKARGMPEDKIVAIGRVDRLELSPRAGESSPNRRVEFEVGFDGEVAQ